MLDALTARQSGVGGGVVGVDDGAGGCVVCDEALERFAVYLIDDFRPDLIRLAVLDAGDEALGDLVNAAAARQLLTLTAVHVLRLAADECFVRLNWSLKLHPPAGERFAETVRQVPRRPLRDVQLAVQLHAADALQVRRHEVDGDGPSLESELAALEHSAGPDAEPFPAAFLAAAVRHRLVLRADQDALRSAVVAADASRPAGADEPRLGGGVVGEQLEKVDQADAVSVATARCLLTHEYSIVPTSARVNNKMGTFRYNPPRETAGHGTQFTYRPEKPAEFTSDRSPCSTV